MAARPKKIVLFLAAAGVLLLFALFRLDGDKAADFRVTIEATSERTFPAGKIHLSARVEELHLSGGSRPHPSPQRLRYRWVAERGFIWGKGADVSWIAPLRQGRYGVAVLVADEQGAERQATVDVEVVLPTEPKPDRPTPVSSRAEMGGEYRIESVEFEKSEICENEDLLVKVRAVTPPGQEGWLGTRVYFAGMSFAGRDQFIVNLGPAYFDRFKELVQAGRIPMVTVDLVDSRTDKIVARRSLDYRAVECRTPSKGLFVLCTSGTDEIACKANVYPKSDFAPVRYSWDFGDGTKEGTAKAEIWHKLAPKPQTSAGTAYLIDAKAFDKEGNWLEGRYSVIVPANEWVQMQHSGTLPLQATWTPYPEEEEPKTQYKSHVSLLNPFSESVRLDWVEVTEQPCDESEKPVRQRISAESVVGRMVLQSVEQVEFDWRVRPSRTAQCAVAALLGGYGEESSLPAEARWVMPLNAEQLAVPVVDPQQMELATKALQILGQRRGKPVHSITGDEWQALEREGLLPPGSQPQWTRAGSR